MLQTDMRDALLQLLLFGHILTVGKIAGVPNGDGSTVGAGTKVLTVWLVTEPLQPCCTPDQAACQRLEACKIVSYQHVPSRAGNHQRMQ